MEFLTTENLILLCLIVNNVFIIRRNYIAFGKERENYLHSSEVLSTVNSELRAEIRTLKTEIISQREALESKGYTPQWILTPNGKKVFDASKYKFVKKESKSVGRPKKKKDLQ